MLFKIINKKNNYKHAITYNNVIYTLFIVLKRNRKIVVLKN